MTVKQLADQKNESTLRILCGVLEKSNIDFESAYLIVEEYHRLQMENECLNKIIAMYLEKNNETVHGL